MSLSAKHTYSHAEPVSTETLAAVWLFCCPKLRRTATQPSSSIVKRELPKVALLCVSHAHIHSVGIQHMPSVVDVVLLLTQSSAMVCTKKLMQSQQPGMLQDFCSLVNDIGENARSRCMKCKLRGGVIKCKGCSIAAHPQCVELTSRQQQVGCACLPPCWGICHRISVYHDCANIQQRQIWQPYKVSCSMLTNMEAFLSIISPLVAEILFMSGVYCAAIATEQTACKQATSYMPKHMILSPCIVLYSVTCCSPLLVAWHYLLGVDNTK